MFLNSCIYEKLILISREPDCLPSAKVNYFNLDAQCYNSLIFA